MTEAPARPFAHLDAPNADLYRAVMGVFVAAKRRFLVHLRPEDVLEALRGPEGPPVEAAAVEAALKQLESWRNLQADPDTSRVTTVDDFYRPRYLYQLTPEGEAAELALAAYDEALGNRGELQSVALEDIRVRLRSLRRQAEDPDPDAAVVHSLLRELSTLLDGLAANASAFMSSLQRTIDLQDVDEDAFIAYKDRLIGYLERFVGDLVVKSAEIVATLRALDGIGVERLLELAAVREAADAAPDQRDDDAVRVKLDGWRARWSGLRSWFIGDRAHPSQAALLRQRARAAIPALLAAVTTLQERRTGRSDRSADFRALARWFAEAPSDAEAHRLWRAAFGLASARHLTIDAQTLEARQRSPCPPPPAGQRRRRSGSARACTPAGITSAAAARRGLSTVVRRASGWRSCSPRSAPRRRRPADGSRPAGRRGSATLVRSTVTSSRCSSGCSGMRSPPARPGQTVSARPPPTAPWRSPSSRPATARPPRSPRPTGCCAAPTT